MTNSIYTRYFTLSSIEETESSVGDFNVDIFATDADTGRRVIIENQLEETDHDHLGKLITYASGKAADLVIWIVRKARPEHTPAIEWLNNHTDEGVGFLLCEIKLYRKTWRLCNQCLRATDT